MRKFVLNSVLLSLVVLMMYCSTSEVENESIETQVEENKFTQYKLSEGVDMPNVVVETNKDTTFDLSKLDKPSLINFWATW